MISFYSVVGVLIGFSWFVLFRKLRGDRHAFVGAILAAAVWPFVLFSMIYIEANRSD